MRTRRILLLILFVVAVVMTILVIRKKTSTESETPVDNGKKTEVKKGNNEEFIVIDKQSMTLKLYSPNDSLIYEFPMACGKNYGNKRKPGDMKTPEGDFKIEKIQDASTWVHDFKDGKGEIAGAYGPYFFRLETPGHSGIGIHGTHAPESLGTRATEGCIRVENKNLLKLKEHVRVGTKVKILPSDKDIAADKSDAEENKEK